MNHYVTLALTNRKSCVHLHALYSPRTALRMFTPRRDHLMVCLLYLPRGTENKSTSGRDMPVTAWAYLRPINVWCLLYESLGFGAGSEPGSQNIVRLFILSVILNGIFATASQILIQEEFIVQNGCNWWHVMFCAVIFWFFYFANRLDLWFRHLNTILCW
jgi:hypothetical protein